MSSTTMTKEEIIKILKPLVKECIDEYIKEAITKLVFEKAAEKIMQQTTQIVDSTFNNESNSSAKKIVTESKKPNKFCEIVDSIDPYDVAMAKSGLSNM